MDAEHIGHAVRLLRTARQPKRMTQKELAQAASLNIRTIQAVERGQAEPKAETLSKIARALGVSALDLLEQPPPLRAVRFRAKKRLRTREHTLAQVSRWLSDYRFMEDLLDDHQEWRLRDIQPTHANSPQHLAGIARSALGLRADEPVFNICGLLESNGLKVRSMPVQSNEFFGLSVAADDGGPAIVVNTWERISVERWIFSAAHELGHLVMHLDSYQADETEEPEAEERQADSFASHFLMPHDAFIKRWRETDGLHLVDRVLHVKRIFSVSYQTVLLRLRDLGERNDLWKRFHVGHGRLHGGSLRGHIEPAPADSSAYAEPGALEAFSFREQRLAALVKRALADGSISMSRSAEILGISLSEMRRLASEWAE